ncbi:MAG: DUF5602 domain-containing protein [Bacteroidetes bacterium]|nr:DUF5602 domain-containing protein [Bacteroidota bacterium]
MIVPPRAAAFVLMALATLAGACSEDAITPPRAGTFYGLMGSMGNGHARPLVVMDDNGNPTSVGVALSENALNGLPDTATQLGISLPPGSFTTGYDHVEIDWHPQGHPSTPFTAPHFDIYFFTISFGTRDGITGTGSDSARATMPPSAPAIPPGYVAAPPVVPNVGMRWVDTSGPEFHGKPFERALSYGFYAGSMAFAGPMITRNYLLSQPNISATMPLPAAFPQRDRYYAAKYSIHFDAGTREYVIMLDGLVRR